MKGVNIPRKVPAYIRQNLDQTSKYMDKVVKLNIELERWIESVGLAEYADEYFDYLSAGSDIRYFLGYVIPDKEDFLNTIEEDLEYK